MSVDMQWLIDGFNKSMQERNYPGRQQQPYTYIGNGIKPYKWVQYNPVEKFNPVNLPVTESTARAFRNRDNSTRFPLSKRYEIAKYVPVENSTSSPIPPATQTTTSSTNIKPVAKSVFSNKLVKGGGLATIANIGTSFIPGSNNEIESGLLNTIVGGLESARDYTGYGAMASGAAALIPGTQPVSVPLAGVLGIASGLTGSAANVLRSIYGKEKVIQKSEEPNGQIAIDSFDQSVEPSSISGIIDIPQGEDMSYSDILATSMLGRLDMKAPISNQTIASNLASLANMSRTESGLAFAVKRGDKVDFKDDYGKQMNMLLGYARTINDPNASEAEKSAATAAANVGTYGLDIYKHDADDMNKQAMRTEQIIKGYSKASSNTPMIQSLQKEITKYDKMIEDSEKGLAKDLADLVSKGIGTGKDRRDATRADEINTINAWQPAIDAAKLRRKQYEDKIIELQNSERRIGTFQEYLNSVKSVNGQSGVKTYTPNWDKSKGEQFGKSDLDRLAKDLNLGQAQKVAIYSVVNSETIRDNTGSRNSNDGGKTAVGIAGWRDDREAMLVKHAEALGLPPESKDAQITFFKKEIVDPNNWIDSTNQKSGNELLSEFYNTKDQRRAIELVNKYFIRPDEKSVRDRIAKFGTATIN